MPEPSDDLETKSQRGNTPHPTGHRIELNTWRGELRVDCSDCEATLASTALPVETPHAVRDALSDANITDANYLRQAWENHVHMFEEDTA